MEDVFDLTGKPPEGWVHAVFFDGPYADDVGRCVPGPPTPDPLVVTDDAGKQWQYRVLSVDFTHVAQGREDLRVMYATEIPKDSGAEGWWSETGGEWTS